MRAASAYRLVRSDTLRRDPDSRPAAVSHRCRRNDHRRSMKTPRHLPRLGRSGRSNAVSPRFLLGLVLVAAVFALGLWQNLAALESSQYHPDESRWLNRAHYLLDLGHPTGEVWEDRYLTRGQPPMGSYVTGLGLLLQGRDLTTNGPWDFHYGNESTITWNAVKGNMPAAADIQAARRTNAALGALTCAVLFLIVAKLTNVVGGLLAGVFMAVHPLQIYLASIGVSDAVFTLFFAFAALTALVLATNPTWPRSVALGLVLGCGASTKLTPLLVSLPLAGLGMVILADPYLRRLPVVGAVWRCVSRVDVAPRRRLGWMLISLPAIAATTFVLTYPYLWPDPIGRTKALIDFRQHEMENQARIWPTSSVDSRSEALHRTWHNLEHVYSSTGRGMEWLGRSLGQHWDRQTFDLPLAGLGLVVLLWLAWRRGIAGPHALTLAVVGVQSGVILAGLRVDFNRYYLPLVLASGVGIGVLTGQAWSWASALARRRHRSLRRRIAPALPPRAPVTGPAPRRSRIADR
jgi:hypothetical protein